MFGLSLSVVIASCGMSKNAHRIPVTCSGPPDKSDYLINERGDLLINCENVNSDSRQTEKIFRKNQNNEH